MLYLLFLSTDAINSGSSSGTYELIAKDTYFTLYDNVTIRRAKIIITFNGDAGRGVGTMLGNITPCNPTNDVTLYNGLENSSIVASANGNLYARHSSSYTYVTMDLKNYTCYWTY